MKSHNKTITIKLNYCKKLIMTDKLSNSQYYQYLQSNLGVLVDNGRIGLSKFQPADIQTKPNKYLEMVGIFKNFHFCVDIPYAGRVLNWEIIFNPLDFSELPDFDFNDYSFLPEPDINYIAENVPSWDTWDLTNSQSLLSILNEFLDLYKKAQIEKLFKQNKLSNFRTQYEDLLQTVYLTSENVEVQIDTRNEMDFNSTSDDQVLINFLIILPIDFSQLPEYCQPEGEDLLNPGEDFAHLNIQFRKLDNSQTKVSLTLGTRAEQLLGKLKLPKFNKNTTLAGYAQAIQTTIENQIQLICSQYRARSTFVASIADTFASGIVEYDAYRFHKVTFIYEDFEDYDCLVTIQLGTKFPQERPKIQLHSLYCQVGRNCNTSVVYHSYDPEATSEENIKALREILHPDVKLFQNHKH